MLRAESSLTQVKAFADALGPWTDTARVGQASRLSGARFSASKLFVGSAWAGETPVLLAGQGWGGRSIQLPGHTRTRLQIKATVEIDRTAARACRVLTAERIEICRWSDNWC